MPEICGIFSFKKDRNLSANEIHFELISISKSKGETLSVWSDENIGLAQQNIAAKTDVSPAINPSNKFCIVSDACLTNRTELLNEFGVLSSERSGFATGNLILSAFEKWGEDCVEHLVGDFAFAIWDKQRQKLFCARDHMGGSKLYYYQDKKRLIFASSPRGILNFSNVEKKFNKNKLSYFLLPEPHLLSVEESWFENILPLPAATILTADGTGIKTRKYWQPEIGLPLPYKNNEEVLEAFRELMFELVAAPLQEFNSVTALLSGGLDSSSIVSVAAKILEKQNKELTVFSAVLEDQNDPHFSDERYFIDRFKSFPNVMIKYVSAPGSGTFTDLTELFENNDHPLINSRHYFFKEFSREARKIGSGTILEGVFGEFGPTYPGESGFAELLANVKWVTLWRELRKRKKLYGHSIRYNFRANALNPILPDFLKKLKRGNVGSEIPLNTDHPLQEHFFQELLKGTDIQKCPVGQLDPDHRKSQLADFSFLHRKITEFPSSTFGGEPVEYRYPFLNKKLLEFCLAVPLKLKIHDGYARYLVRAGLDGILPPEIQWRTSKTPFSPDYIRRYFDQIDQVKQMLGDIKPNDPLREVLDIEKIGRLVDLSIKETDSYTIYDRIAFDSIPQAVYLIYFMRGFSEFRL